MKNSINILYLLITLLQVNMFMSKVSLLELFLVAHKHFV